MKKEEVYYCPETDQIIIGSGMRSSFTKGAYLFKYEEYIFVYWGKFTALKPSQVVKIGKL